MKIGRAVILCTAALLASTAVEARQRITGPSPFAACTADDAGNQPGRYYPDAEVEPWVDANPADHNNLIAGWQQDRWSNGGARGLVSAYTSDGGQTWHEVVVPGVSKCSGGVWDRATDPWVTFSPDGTAYFMSLSFMNDEPNGAGGDNAMLVSRSVDGGRSWGPPATLILDTDGQIFNDKNSITADPHDSRYVYAVWDRYIDYSYPHRATGGGRSHGDGAAAARTAMAIRAAKNGKGKPSFTAPVYFARTTDGGATWEPAKMIYETGPDAQTLGSIVVVLPNGTVMNVFADFPADGSAHLRYQTSTDHGASFAPAAEAVAMVMTGHMTVTPDSHRLVRDASTLFDVAVDRETGALYAVWQDGRWGGIDRVAFAMSVDNGVTWSEPERINLTPRPEKKFRNQAFVPSVEVGANHRVHVTYYDFRNDADDGKELADYWAISCDPHAADCTKRAAWGNETRLTAKSFNILNAPYAIGHFLGDYQGLVRKGRAVVAVFGKSVGRNLNDMFSQPLK